MIKPNIKETENIRIFAVNTARRIFPRKFRLWALKLCSFLLDMVLRLLGLQDERLPLRSKAISVGRGDFKKIGKKFLDYFIELGDLKSDYKVLDVGCGFGRMAIPLTKYLDKEGLYEGFDIMEEGIKWCTKNISPQYPNFNFHLADIFNKEYNPKGKLKASAYTFPWPDEFFDFVFLTSVFTHMLPEDLENYLSEIARVLKRGKRCFISYFLLNEQSLALINSGKSKVNFKFDHGKYRTIERDIFESAISYQESYILDLYQRYGLRVQGTYYGSWCGRKNFLNYQDIIIAGKGAEHQLTKDTLFLASATYEPEEGG